MQFSQSHDKDSHVVLKSNAIADSRIMHFDLKEKGQVRPYETRVFVYLLKQLIQPLNLQIATPGI